MSSQKKNHPRTERAARRGRRGAVMVVVMMIVMATLLVGLASMVVSTTDVKLSSNSKRGAMAFFAAEAGIDRSIQELREDNAWNAGFTTTALGNGATYAVTVTSVSGQLLKMVSTGFAGRSRRRVEVIVNVDSAFDHALNIGGDLVMAGKPRISAEGVRLNGNALFDLDSGTPTLNLYVPSSSTINYVVGSETDPVTIVDTPPMDLTGARISDENWQILSEKAPSAYSFNNDGIYGNKDTAVTINNLNFDDVPADSDGKRTVYVDGDLILNGTLSGIGSIVATGSIIGQGSFYTHGSTVSFISRDDVLLNFDTNAQSEMNGLTYAEGDYEMHGKIKYTGVVTTFGSATIQNPSEFTNNNDPNFWYTYSAAYNIVADPIDVLLWHELTD